jgi:hypothetical protein
MNFVAKTRLHFARNFTNKTTKTPAKYLQGFFYILKSNESLITFHKSLNSTNQT